MANENVPAAVRKQVKEANRLIKELNARPGEVPRGSEPQNAPRRAEWEAGQPQAAAAPSAEATPVSAPPAEDPAKVIEHKYNVLAGKYNSEVSRLMGQVEALRQDNQVLLNRVAAAPAVQQAAPNPNDNIDLSAVSQKEREEYGEDLVKMMARIARANSSAEVATLKAELERMRGSVQQTQQIGTRTLRERVWQQLDVQVPNWRTINVSQQFVDWLENIDIMSGVARKNGLTQAFEAGDGTRVVGIFKRFIEEDSHTRPTAQSNQRQAQVDPATLVAPGAPRGTGGEAPNSASGKLWSEQEIDDFYSRVQRKRINPDEAKAIEADILAAVRDGRVVPRRDDRFLANAR